MKRVWRKITKTTDFSLKGRVLKVSINIKQNSLLSFKKKFDTFTKPLFISKLITDYEAKKIICGCTPLNSLVLK